MDSYRINKLKHVSCTWNNEQLGLGDPVFSADDLNFNLTADLRGSTRTKSMRIDFAR